MWPRELPVAPDDAAHMAVAAGLFSAVAAFAARDAAVSQSNMSVLYSHSVDLGDAGTWASAAVAVVAAGVAVAAWRAAHRAAEAAERSALIDEQAWHKQQAPTFKAQIEPVNDGGWHRLALQLEGPTDLDDVVVEVLGGELVFTDGHNGVDRPDDGRPRKAWVYSQDGVRTGLRLGEVAKWRVAAAEEHVESDEVQLRIEARAGKAVWRVLVPVAVPGTMQIGPQFWSL